MKSISVRAFVDIGGERFVSIQEANKNPEKCLKAMKVLKEERKQKQSDLALINSTIRSLESSYCSYS